MKHFERVVLAHIQNSILDTLVTLQYAYQLSMSTSDAFTAVLHYCLFHLENKDSDIRTLFVDYSSAFNPVTDNKHKDRIILKFVDGTAVITAQIFSYWHFCLLVHLSSFHKDEWSSVSNNAGVLMRL